MTISLTITNNDETRSITVLNMDRVDEDSDMETFAATISPGGSSVLEVWDGHNLVIREDSGED